MGVRAALGCGWLAELHVCVTWSGVSWVCVECVCVCVCVCSFMCVVCVWVWMGGGDVGLAAAMSRRWVKACCRLDSGTACARWLTAGVRARARARLGRARQSKTRRLRRVLRRARRPGAWRSRQPVCVLDASRKYKSCLTCSPLFLGAARRVTASSASHAPARQVLPAPARLTLLEAACVPESFFTV